MVAKANFKFRRQEGFFPLQTRPGFAQMHEEASCQE